MKNFSHNNQKNLEEKLVDLYMELKTKENVSTIKEKNKRKKKLKQIKLKQIK